MQTLQEQPGQAPVRPHRRGFTAAAAILSVLAAAAVAAAAFLAVPILREASSFAHTKVVLYDGPKTMKTSKNASVTVDGRPLFVYDTAVNNGHTWVASGKPELSSTPVAYFDFQGKVRVAVTMPFDVKSCALSPLAEKISTHINGRTVTFDLTKSGDYTLQFNGSPEHALHLFANPPETNVPDKNDPNVLYVGPGEWNIDTINVQSGQTLYIAGGAVVHGTVIASKAQNVTIRGRGIIDGSKYDGWMVSGSARIPLDLEQDSNVNVEGILLLDPNAWTFQAYESSGVTVKNIKIVSARPNGDGISLQSCQNVMVSDSFVRTWDDSLVVKNYGSDSVGINFKNMMVWTDLAQSCEIGYETNKGQEADSTIMDVNFDGIDVVNNFHKPVIGIHNSDDCLIQNIHYNGVTVENAQMGGGDAGANNQLIDIGVLFSQWSSTQERGNIRDVTIENVNVLGGKFCPSRIEGYDATHTVEGVTVRNLSILGKKITSASAGKFLLNNYVKNVSFQ